MMEERIQNDRFHFQAETQKRDAGKQREGEWGGREEGKMVGSRGRPKKDKVALLCVSCTHIPQAQRRHGESLQCKLLI